MPQNSPWDTEKPKDMWWVQLAAQADYSFTFHKTSCRARGFFQSSQCHTSKARDYTPPRLSFHKGIHPSYRLLYKLCKTMEQILCPKSRLDVYAREQTHTQAFKPAPFCPRLGFIKRERLSRYYVFTGKHTHTHTLTHTDTDTRAHRGPSLHFLNTVKLPLTPWQHRI